MNKLTSLLLGGLALIIACVALGAALNRPVPASHVGSAVTGNSLRLATTSTAEVSSKSVEVLFATTTTVTATTDLSDCKTRVITTGGQALLVKFSPGINKNDYGSTSLQNGLYDAIVPASTTVIFDGGLTGCDAWIGIAVGGNGSTTVNLAEFR